MAGDYFAGALGTIGGGNHFCEVQVVDDATEAGPLDRQRVHLLVHSGSRSLGASIFADVIAANGAMHDGLEIGTDAAVDYMLDHNSAVAWASLNRQMIAERAAYVLRADVRRVTAWTRLLLAGLAGALLVYAAIATDVGGAREVIDDGINGILIGANDVDAIQREAVRLYNESEARIEMARRGMTSVQERFTAEKMVDRQMALYEKWTQEKRGA